MVMGVGCVLCFLLGLFFLLSVDIILLSHPLIVDLGMSTYWKWKLAKPPSMRFTAIWACGYVIGAFSRFEQIALMCSSIRLMWGSTLSLGLGGCLDI